MSAASRRRFLAALFFGPGLAASVGVAAAAPTEPAPARLRLGDPLPDLVLEAAAGGSLRLGSLRGQVLVVNFFASYCKPCRVELPLLVELIAQLRRERQSGDEAARRRPEVKLLPIGVDAVPADSARFAAGLALDAAGPVSVLLDGGGQARAAFDPQRYPCTFLIDAAGVVRHINRGFGPGYRVRVERWLRGLLS